MLKAAVPSPTATSSRLARPAELKVFHAPAKVARGALGSVSRGLRASCFHMATPLSTTVITATAWMIWMSSTALKSCSSVPNTSALTTMPSSSMT